MMATARVPPFLSKRLAPRALALASGTLSSCQNRDTPSPLCPWGLPCSGQVRSGSPSKRAKRRRQESISNKRSAAHVQRLQRWTKSDCLFASHCSRHAPTTLASKASKQVSKQAGKQASRKPRWRFKHGNIKYLIVCGSLPPDAGRSGSSELTVVVISFWQVYACQATSPASPFPAI